MTAAAHLTSRRVQFDKETGTTSAMSAFEWKATQTDPMSKRRRNRAANRMARASRKANRR